MSAADFYFAIADGWSMGIQYGAKTSMCRAFSAITESSSDEQIMNVFADWSNAYWGKDFCAGGFCKCLFLHIFLCIFCGWVNEVHV